MKRASRMMTSRTMSGSGAMLPPNQEAMPRLNTPRAAATRCCQSEAWPSPGLPTPLCQVPAVWPEAWAGSSVQPGVSEARSLSKGPILFPPRPNPGASLAGEDRSGPPSSLLEEEAPRHSSPASGSRGRQGPHCQGPGREAPPAASADVISKRPRRQLLGEAGHLLPALSAAHAGSSGPARQSGPFSPQLAVTSGGRRCPAAGVPAAAAGPAGGAGSPAGGQAGAVQKKGVERG